MYKLQPVNVSRPQTGTADTPTARADNLHGPEFRSLYNIIAGRATILHIAMTVPGNISRVKEVVMGRPLEAVFQGSIYDNNDLASSLENATSEICEALRSGETPRTLNYTALAPAILSARIRPDQYDSLRNPEEPRSAHNKTWREHLPAVKSFICRDGDTPDGFIYRIPYMTNMSYPQELYDMLKEFARKHSNDNFNSSAMLFRMQLWVDIVSHPDLQTEQFNRTRRSSKPPMVSLSKFLAYFESWLKAHELLRLIEYGHPFRVIDAMYHADLEANPEFYAIQESAIDEQKVRTLAQQAKVIRSEWPISHRVPFWPFLAPGTMMPLPSDLAETGIHAPNLAEKAFIGLPSVRILGPPSRHLEALPYRYVAAPKAIADMSFHGIETSIPSNHIPGLLSPELQTLTAIFAPHRLYGPVWKHQFQPDEENNLAVRLRNHAFGVPELPAGPLELWMGYTHAMATVRRAQLRNAWLKRQGLVNARLLIGSDGLPYLPGRAYEDEEFLQNALTLTELHGEIREPDNDDMVDPGQNITPPPDANAAIPNLVPRDLMDRMIQHLHQRPKFTHVAWGRALDQLREMLPEGANEDHPLPPVSQVLEVLERSKAQHEQDHGGMMDLATRLENEGPGVGAHTSVMRWVTQSLCRLHGVETGSSTDTYMWERGVEDQVRAYDYPFFSQVQDLRRSCTQLSDAQNVINQPLILQSRREDNGYVPDRTPLEE